MFAIPVFAIHMLIPVASIFPRVEDPLPHTIGLGFPFMLAGAGGILADVISAGSPREQRDQAVRSGSVYGFRVGVGLYALSLAVQLPSGL